MTPPRIFRVQEQSFGHDKEALLTAQLLEDPTVAPVVSLLALLGDKPVGHILFTRASFDGQQDFPLLHILAPLALIPPYQRQGIGGQLIKTGLDALRRQGSRLVFVLGHRDYYPRFGFLPGAGKKGYAPHTPFPPNTPTIGWFGPSVSTA